MAIRPSIFDDQGVTEEPQGSLPVDMGKAAVAGVADLGAQAAGLTAEATNEKQGGLSGQVRDLLNDAADTVRSSISPANKRALDAEVIPAPGQPSALDTPFHSTAMKLAGMAPQLAGAAVASGPAAGAALFAGQSVAQRLNDTRKEIQAASDEDLIRKYPTYQQVRDMGMPEKEARSFLHDQLNKFSTLATEAAGGAAMGGGLTHALGVTGKGLIKGTLTGAAENAVTMGVGGAAQELALQGGDIETGARQDYSAGDVGKSLVNAAVPGILIGGVAGGYGGARMSRGERLLAEAKARIEARKKIDLEGNMPDPAQKAAIEGTLPVAPPDEEGPLQKRAKAPPKATEATTAPTPGGPPAPSPVRTETPPPSPAPTKESPAPALQGNAPVVDPAAGRPATLAENQPAASPTPPPLTAGEVTAAGFPQKTTREAVPGDIFDTVPRLTPKPPPDVPPVKTEEPVKTDKATGRRVLTAKLEPERLAQLEAAKEQAAVQAKKSEAAATNEQGEQTAEDADAYRKRIMRQKGRGDEEATAKQVVDSLHPGEAEAAHVAQENLALGGDARAQATLYERAKAAVQVAKDAGVKFTSTNKEGKEVVRRTPWTKEQSEAGNRNPTPYLSRLFEINKFVKDYELAQKSPLLQKKLGEKIQDHIAAERATRRGDMEGAHEGRLARNAKMNADFSEKSENKGDDTIAANRDVSKTTEGIKPGETYEQYLARTKSNYIGVQALNDARGSKVRNRTTTAREALQRVRQLITDRVTDKPSELASAQSKLLLGIIDKIEKVAGDTPVHWVDDETFFNNLAATGKMAQNDAESAGAVFAYNTRGTREGVRGRIVAKHTDNPQKEIHNIIHEVVHAATSHALDHNPNFRYEVEQMLALAKEHMAAHPSGEAVREYGLTDVKEFIAEALSNPRFQSYLAEIPVRPLTARKWGLHPNFANVWGALVGAVKKALGLTAREGALLDAVLKHSELYLTEYKVPTMEEGPPSALSFLSNEKILPIAPAELKQAVGDRIGTEGTWRNFAMRTGFKFQTFTQLMETGLKDFGQSIRDLTEAKARMSTYKDKLFQDLDAPLVAKSAELERTYSAGPDPTGKDTMWNYFTKLLNDETISGAFWDRPLEEQTHLGKNNLKGLQAKEQYAEGHARWDALPDSLKALRNELHSYYKTRQEQMALGAIRGDIRMINEGHNWEDLAQWIFKGAKNADPRAEEFKNAIGSDATLKDLKASARLGRIAGPYVQLRRQGDWVVHGKYDIPTPPGATRYNEAGSKAADGNVFGFASRKEAEDFIKSQKDLKVNNVAKVHVDEGGNTHAIDEETGESTKLTKADPEAKEEYRVTMQDRHVEFHDNELAAKRALRELQGHPGLTMHGYEPVKYTPEGRRTDYMSAQIDRISSALTKRKEFQDLSPDQQKLMTDRLAQASLVALGSGRAQSQRLPRTNVLGASRELVRNLAEYANSSGGYLAKQRYQPEIDKHLKDMRKIADSKNPDSGVTSRRRSILNEVEQRAYADDYKQSGFWDPVINRLLQLSYLDKLGSPAFHLINSTQPWVMGLPVLAGRHNAFRAIRELNRAYADMGAAKAVIAGIKDTGKALRQNTGFTDYNSRNAERFAKRPDGAGVVKMLDHLIDTGLISKDAGLELSRHYNPQANVIGRALDRTDLMARQVGSAIEQINRTVVGVAAYRLELAKTGNHEAAVQYAHKVVHDSQGDYSNWNAAPIFKSRIGRLALQFKKYSQMTYYLLGKSIAGTIKRDPEAARTLLGLMITYTSLAGALGLPTEGLQALFLAANLGGVTNTKWSDVEHGFRKQAAAVMGPGAAEAFSRGIPRYLGLDLNTRIGLNNLIMPMGDLKSTKTDDIYAYAAKAFAGAPVALLVDWVQGAQALAKGDFTEAARLMVPMKVFADSVKGYQMATQGTKTASGRVSMEPTGVGQGIVRAIGFQPGAYAEKQEQRSAMYSEQGQFRKDRQSLKDAYVNATTSAERSRAEKAVADWNKGQTSNDKSKITTQELLQAKRSREKESSKQDLQGGIRTTSRDRQVRSNNQFYNVQ